MLEQSTGHVQVNNKMFSVCCLAIYMYVYVYVYTYIFFATGVRTHLAFNQLWGDSALKVQNQKIWRGEMSSCLIRAVLIPRVLCLKKLLHTFS